jgi:hypothetical protein
MMLSSGEGCKPGICCNVAINIKTRGNPMATVSRFCRRHILAGAGGMLMGQDLMVVTTAGNYNRKDHSVPSLRVTGDAVLPSLL